MRVDMTLNITRWNLGVRLSVLISGHVLRRTPTWIKRRIMHATTKSMVGENNGPVYGFTSFSGAPVQRGIREDWPKKVLTSEGQPVPFLLVNQSLTREVNIVH